MKFMLILPLIALGVFVQPNSAQLNMCNICTSAAMLVQEYGAAGLQKAQTYLDGQCAKADNAILVSLCDAAANAMCEAFVNMLQNGLTPQQACVDMKLCKSSSAQARVAARAHPQKFGLNFLCPVCEALVTDAENAAINDEGELEQMIDKYCANLEISWFVKECDNAVAALVPDLFKAIEAKVTPQVACQDVDLCSKSALKHKKTPAKKVAKAKAVAGSNQEICDVCMGAAKALVDELSNPSVQGMIQQALMKVCGIIPSSEKSMCTMVVQSEFPAIWSQVMNMLTPQKICTLIKLC